MSVLSPVVLSWDGENRRIYLKSGVSDYYPIEDIYHEYRAARRTDEGLRKYNALLRAEGNVPKGGGAFTPRYVVLLEGTKIVPFNETLQISQLGDMITDNPDVDPSLYDISTLTVPKVVYIKPSEAETIQLNNESIVYASFQGAVWYDANSPYSDEGSPTRPNGNTERPVNSMDVAIQIANERGFNTIQLRSNAVLGTGHILDKKTLVGQSHVYTELEIQDAASVVETTVVECKVHGVLDGRNVFKNCIVHDITYLNGHIHDCAIEGAIVLGGDTDAFLSDCSRSDVDLDPVIDMGGSGQNLVLADYIGHLVLRNLTGNNTASLGLSQGTVVLENTVTSGTVVARGVGSLMDINGNTIYSGQWNGATIVNQLVGQDTISSAVWDRPAASHSATGSFGWFIQKKLLTVAKFIGLK